MLARTQIGGKYDVGDSTIFQLKKRLQSLGLEVRHPVSNKIIKTIDNRGFAFDPTQISFFEVEVDYYKSISNCDFHTVNNRFQDDKGYLGESASLEIGYAILKGKQVLLMHPPQF